MITEVSGCKTICLEHPTNPRRIRPGIICVILGQSTEYILNSRVLAGTPGKDRAGEKCQLGAW